MDSKLCAGFARVDITPDFSVGLDGYHNEDVRFSQGVKDPIYLTCIALADGTEKILIYDADLLSINDWLAGLIRQRVCPVTGIFPEKIFCGATHTHSAPASYSDREESARFRELLLDAADVAARQAIADLSPSEMYSATKVVRGMNFVRHYLMEDGSYAGSGFGNHDIRYIAHAAESDPRMLLVQFAREGKPSIVMMNWQAHNDNVSQVGQCLISSSYTGHTRSAFEKETGMHFAFIMGAAGNQNPDSRIPEEHHGLNYIEYGKALAKYAVEATKDLKPVSGRGIVTKHVVFEATVNHSWDHMLDEADEVLRVWKTEGMKAGRALGATYGFTSPYQARYIRVRAAMGKTTPVELNAFRIGDMGFVTIPNDVFSTVGLHIRLYSPFANTMIISGNCRYLACMTAYDYRSYEADTALYVKGTAEKVAETIVDMLTEIA